MPRTHTKVLKEDFLKAYEAYSDALFRYSLYKLSDREKAKDVVQDTFVRYWEYVAANGKVDNIKAFLYRIASNAIVDNYRKRKDISLDLLSEDGYDPMDSESHHLLPRSLDGKKVLELVNSLDPKSREMMLLRFVEGLSVKEIAMILDERENTVSVKIHRSLKELHSLFETQ